MRRRALGTGRLMRRKQRGGAVYCGDWKDASGKRHRKVLSGDKRTAERLLADIIRQRDLCAAGLGIEEGFDRPIAELVDEYLAELHTRRSPAHYDRVKGVLSRVLPAMKVGAVRDIQPQAYQLYRRERQRDGIANRTVNLELTILRALLNWAISARYIAVNPLQGLKPLPAGRGYERRPRRALSEEEIERFIVASEEIDTSSKQRSLATRTTASGKNDPRPGEVKRPPRVPTVPQTPLWLTLLETGARFGEMVRTTWGDFSEAQSALTFRASTTKSRKERRVPMRPALVTEIARLRLVHLQVRGRIPTAGDHIFLSPRGLPWAKNRRIALIRFYAVLERAGIPRVDERGEKLDIHATRHTFASRLARNGVGLAQAQKLLGHSDPKLTAACYTHLDAEDLRAAVEGLPPVRRATAAIG